MFRRVHIHLLSSVALAALASACVRRSNDAQLGDGIETASVSIGTAQGIQASEYDRVVVLTRESGGSASFAPRGDGRGLFLTPGTRYDFRVQYRKGQNVIASTLAAHAECGDLTGLVFTAGANPDLNAKLCRMPAGTMAEDDGNAQNPQGGPGTAEAIASALTGASAAMARIPQTGLGQNAAAVAAQLQQGLQLASADATRAAALDPSHRDYGIYVLEACRRIVEATKSADDAARLPGVPAPGFSPVAVELRKANACAHRNQIGFVRFRP